MFDPAIGIRTRTEPEAVTGILNLRYLTYTGHTSFSENYPTRA